MAIEEKPTRLTRAQKWITGTVLVAYIIYLIGRR
jgi:hypothetical protein